MHSWCQKLHRDSNNAQHNDHSKQPQSHGTLHRRYLVETILDRSMLETKKLFARHTIVINTQIGDDDHKWQQIEYIN